MKLNDPFGRVANRNRRNYGALRDRLLEEGIRDSGAVRRFTANMTATALKLLLPVFAISLALMVFFPQLLAGLLALTVLIVLWVAAVYFQTRMHLKRYLREECDEP